MYSNWVSNLQGWHQSSNHHTFREDCTDIWSIIDLHKLNAGLRPCMQHTRKWHYTYSKTGSDSLCKNNLILLMCLSFVCPAFGCYHLLFIVLSCCLPCYAALIFFVCFYRTQFCSPAISQTFLSQPKAGFHLLETGKISLNWSARFIYTLYQQELRAVNILVDIISQWDNYWLSLVHTFISIRYKWYILMLFLKEYFYNVAIRKKNLL